MDNIKNYKKKGEEGKVTDTQFEKIVRDPSLIKTPYPTDWCYKQEEIQSKGSH